MEFNDRFEDFIDVVSKEDKKFLLLGDFNKNLLNEENERDWSNLTISLCLSQLVCEPTRVTNDSATLIDHTYTNNEETIQHVNLNQLCLRDHYALCFVFFFFVFVFFLNRKCKSVVGKNTHHVINYRSIKKFNETTFLGHLSLVPWEIIQNLSF